MKSSSQMSVDGSTSVLHEMENMSFCLDYILKSQNAADIKTRTNKLDRLEKLKFEPKKNVNVAVAAETPKKKNKIAPKKKKANFHPV